MDLNVRHKTIRLLEENVENLHDLELGKELIVLTPKVQSTKLKVDKPNFIKIKTFAFTVILANMSIVHGGISDILNFYVSYIAGSHSKSVIWVQLLLSFY